MSLIVSWLAGQMRRPAALLAGGEVGPLAGVAVALAAVAEVPVAGVGMGWAQLAALAAMMASAAARAGQGTRTMITSVPSPTCDRRAWHPLRLHMSPLGWSWPSRGAGSCSISASSAASVTFRLTSCMGSPSFLGGPGLGAVVGGVGFVTVDFAGGGAGHPRRRCRRR